MFLPPPWKISPSPGKKSADARDPVWFLYLLFMVLFPKLEPLIS